MVEPASESNINQGTESSILDQLKSDEKKREEANEEVENGKGKEMVE